RIAHGVRRHVLMCGVPVSPAAHLFGRHLAREGLKAEDEIEHGLVTVHLVPTWLPIARAIHERFHLVMLAPCGMQNQHRDRKAAGDVEAHLTIEAWIEIDEQPALPVNDELGLEGAVIADLLTERGKLVHERRLHQSALEAQTDTDLAWTL